MLQCKLCDYLRKTVNSDLTNEDLHFCELTNVIFHDDIDNLDMNHPCHCIQQPVFQL